MASNLRLLTRSGPSERSRLIKVLLLFLQEETRFRLYRFDVRRFFDSLSVDESTLTRIAIWKAVPVPGSHLGPKSLYP
jgi:hypothetical protein